MSFYVKMGLLSAFTLGLNQLAHSDEARLAYLGLFGTQAEVHAYELDTTVQNMIRNGADRHDIEFVRRFG